MKLFYPYPSIFGIDPAKTLQYPKSIGIVAYSPEKDLIIVRELLHPAVWQDFWTDIQTQQLSSIRMRMEENKPQSELAEIATNLEKGLQYLIIHGYLLLGFMHIDSEVLDPQIIEERTWLRRRRIEHFTNMLSGYINTRRFPVLHDQKYIQASFLGHGEKMFAFEQISFSRVAQMTLFFRGSLSGVFGIAHVDNLQFLFLSRNLTTDTVVKSLILEKKDRDTIYQHLIKTNMVIPAGGFRFDYGLWGFTTLPNWNQLEQMDSVKLILEQYRQYVRSVSIGKIIIPSSSIPSPPWSFPIAFQKETVVSPIPPDQRDISTQGILIEQQPTITPPPSAISLSKPSIPLGKPSIPKIEPQEEITIQSDTSAKDTGEYEDVFNPTAVKEFETDILSIIKENERILESDIGEKIDLQKMSPAEKTQDLAEALVAMSQLEVMAEKNEAVSRLYFPPPTLLSYADEDGMTIGGSTCFISYGAGRNIWMIPEFKREEMFGKFYNDESLRDQIEDLDLINEKDIQTPAELEEILEKAFKRLIDDDQVFLGICQLEGNGFERNVFDECPLSDEDIVKLMKIHLDHRQKIEFPELSEENWIEIRYYGRSQLIQFIQDPNAIGNLDLVQEVVSDPRYEQGVMTGIMCLDEEAAYFFILTDNFNDVSQDSASFQIDQETLARMYTYIESRHIVPTSWCKFVFGFPGMKLVNYWDEVEDSDTAIKIKNAYREYLEKQLKIKEEEDKIRNRVESQDPTKMT